MEGTDNNKHRYSPSKGYLAFTGALTDCSLTQSRGQVPWLRWGREAKIWRKESDSFTRLKKKIFKKFKHQEKRTDVKTKFEWLSRQRFMSPHSLPCIAPPLQHFFLTFVYLNIKIVNLQFGSEYEYAYSSDFKQIDSIFLQRFRRNCVLWTVYIFLCVELQGPILQCHISVSARPACYELPAPNFAT